MKSALKSLLIVLLLSTLVITPEVVHVVGSPGRAIENTESLQSSLSNPPQNRTFLTQTFDGESTGTVPKNWNVAYPQYGNITVVGNGYGGKGNCSMVVDNSTINNPCPYILFPIQTNTIGMSFAIRVPNSSATNPIVEVFVDEGNFSGGANIMFRDGTIGYRSNGGSFFVLRSSYVFDRWYKITMLLNIPQNVYNVYIDDHLEAVNAMFFGSCTQLLRLTFNETGGTDGLSLPVAYVDEIWGRQGIEIPREYSTIQEGINAANESDIVFVTRQRTYFESLTVNKSIWLYGEDIATTVIDAGLATPKSVSNGVLIEADNVRMTGFTVRSTPYGAGIHVQGSNNIVEYNVVTNGLGDGIGIVGSGNFLSGNVITSNRMYGVNISGSDSTLVNNTITSNDAGGVLLVGSNSIIEDNFIGSNFDTGIWIVEGGNNLVRNNTIRANALGIKCNAGTVNNRIFQNRFVGNNHKPQAVDNGLNKWDDGYPYLPNNKTGGGNYWSDIEGVDRYFGASQNQRSCFLAPDGISDTPYTRVHDRYPLFVIQNVTDDTKTKTDDGPCAEHYVDYGTGVVVTAYLLRNVTITNATVFVEYLLAFDPSQENITMGISDPSNNTWKATIPGKKYGMAVTYNVSVHAELDMEVNSTNYPLSGPFSVEDHTSPTIGTGAWIPFLPDNETTILVWTTVTEPADASGVAGVTLSYLFGSTVWTADMVKANDDNYTALMPKQPGNAIVSYNITALDKAGNKATNSTGASIRVVIVSELSVSNTITSTEPCDIDLGVMYRGQKITDSHLTLSNKGQENLAWNITIVNSGDWLKSILPGNGVLRPGNSTTVALSVDTTSCLDPNLYVTELTVIANGSVPRWVVLLRFIVRDIVIDGSWCSKPTPLRSNVNEIQYFAFHAKWTHNCTEAGNGKITVNVNGTSTVLLLSVNSTGWASFSYNSSKSGLYTFGVQAVDFIYIDHNQVYHITSFTQKATNLTAIWDRVLVNLEIVNGRVGVNSNATITWTRSAYESDGSPFVGSVNFNDTLNKATVGRYCITTSSINDTKYNLTAFQSNSVFCIWDRIKINVGGASNKQTQVGKSEKIWVVGIYEYDNMLFKGANGTLYLDVYEFNMSTQHFVYNRTDPMDWSSLYDRWEKSYSFDTPGPRRFVVSSKQFEDRLYNLTASAKNDLVGPTDITWFGGTSPWWWPWSQSPTLPPTSDNLSFDIANETDEKTNSTSDQPVPVQGALEVPFWAIAAIAVTIVVGMVLMLGVLLLSGKQRARKGTNPDQPKGAHNNQPKGKLPKERTPPQRH